MKKRFYIPSIILSLVVLFLGYETYRLNRRVIDLRKTFHRKLKKYRSNLRTTEFVVNKVFRNEYEFPKELKNISYLKDDILLDVKEVKVRNAYTAYNPSIIEYDKGFLLFFRYDVLYQLFCNKIHTCIGYAQLDNKLNQTEKEFVKLETGSNFSEDPRVVKAGEEYYLIYNDIFDDKDKRRGMHFASLDFENKTLKTVIPMDLKLKNTEKNWGPFVYQGKNKQIKLCFEYEVSHPRQIISMDNLENPSYVEITQQRDLIENIPWNKKWGKPLGGTPARLVDGEYLGFFHSKFIDKNGVWWYVMGAYTFEPNPPFRITRVSPHPILFKGIYDSEYQNTADPSKCVIFPGSFAIKTKNNGQTLLYLACGENDSAIKILTMDKEALLDSLILVNGE